MKFFANVCPIASAVCFLSARFPHDHRRCVHGARLHIFFRDDVEEFFRSGFSDPECVLRNGRQRDFAQFCELYVVVTDDGNLFGDPYAAFDQFVQRSDRNVVVRDKKRGFYRIDAILFY